MRVTSQMIAAAVNKAEDLNMLNLTENRARTILQAALDAAPSATHNGPKHKRADRDLDRYHDHAGWVLGHDD